MSDTVTQLDSAQQPWMRMEGLRRLLDAIKAGGGEVRVVGGCVRDVLLGRPMGDVDLAVNLPPEKVADILTKAGLKVVPTGIDHGTVTAVADHKGYEITSLRHDVETDGRRAKVAFTDDWQADAARRDFTFNALYAAADGKLYDYFKGREDLAEGKVRFIGDARERIREDVLRILRFFRFHAWFGRGTPDADGLAACRELAGLIPTLSVERVWREVIKLITAENPLPGWQLMKEQGVLQHVLPEADHFARLGALLVVEKKYDAVPSSLVRLAALLPKNENLAIQIAKRLKLSGKEAEKLQMLASLPDKLRGRLDPVPFRRALYEYGAEPARDAVLLLAAEAASADLETALAEAATWEKPTFPLQGNDILKLGKSPGPEVGVILKAVEEWWAGQDFRPGRTECLAEATARAKALG
ncbi:MAG: CCA tRNA nucleotidyltransferase [Alphaproteobacteria bacterium]|nr:CCA tRNA nucleotidyltransferase [Alphaproteobacteria bacterium]